MIETVIFLSRPNESCDWGVYTLWAGQRRFSCDRCWGIYTSFCSLTLLLVRCLQFAHLLPNTVLTSLFSMIMVIVAIRIIRQASGLSAKGADIQQCWQEKNCMINPQTGRLRWTPKCSASLAVVGSLSGLLTEMLGVGGGFLIVPAFQQLSDIRMHGIVATSLMTIALISAIAVASAVHAGAHITVTGGVFIAASVSGMLLGRVLSPRIPAKSIQQGFSAVCLVVAGYLMLKTWI
ncbi:sulfite exporter TauE/SafE family protein [Pseudomonas sp. A-B-26]|uniref:sulfite exporter TauE/SafE family protein n=1 Tax=Pseudomonas sp. A-B-26 TaxID=2832406 RepID=UPI001CBCA5B9|nr:sulfite exporter TauE/SafE family protein [Pseudomonas sp. A-B-26]